MAHGVNATRATSRRQRRRQPTSLKIRATSFDKSCETRLAYASQSGKEARRFVLRAARRRSREFSTERPTTKCSQPKTRK
jgi:hypothetical protein